MKAAKGTTIWVLVFLVRVTDGFVVGPATTRTRQQQQQRYPSYYHWQQQQQQIRVVLTLSAKDKESDNDDDKEDFNPYADPNYPDLEFVNYDDPEYQVDQGVSDEFFPSTTSSSSDKDVEAEIEQMREDRRRRNDEYQFQTYFSKIWQNGIEYAGDWTVYQTSTFLPSNDPQATAQQTSPSSSGVPRLLKAARPLLVKCHVSKTMDEINHASNELSAQERIVHHVVPHDNESNNNNNNDATLSPEAVQTEQEILSHKYWPDLLSPFDFRGQQGIMVCGNASTICTAKPLPTGDNDNANRIHDPHTGPFAEYRAEIGIQHESMRMRIKFDYRILTTNDNKQRHESSPSPPQPPPLHLKSMTVCRETTDGTWPQATKNPAVLEALFGIPGADGGLYDPPPVGSDEQASQYMMLDLDGHATVLFPYFMDQTAVAAHSDNNNNSNVAGYVTSLDWTPGKMRYQVDRKVHAGPGILGLRTLELSEVQSADAQRFRPKDGGRNMRQ